MESSSITRGSFSGRISSMSCGLLNPYRAASDTFLASPDSFLLSRNRFCDHTGLYTCTLTSAPCIPPSSGDPRPGCRLCWTRSRGGNCSYVTSSKLWRIIIFPILNRLNILMRENECFIIIDKTERGSFDLILTYIRTPPRVITAAPSPLLLRSSHKQASRFCFCQH